MPVNSGWARPTRCNEWAVRDMLGQLAFCEEYNRAGLDGTVADLFARPAAEGVIDMDAVNGLGILVRADRPAGDLLAQWRAENLAWRREIRARGREGSTDSLVGPYPNWQQAFYLAQEYAMHADDMECPVDTGETAARLG